MGSVAGQGAREVVNGEGGPATARTGGPWTGFRGLAVELLGGSSSAGQVVVGGQMQPEQSLFGIAVMDQRAGVLGDSRSTPADADLDMPSLQDAVGDGNDDISPSASRGLYTLINAVPHDRSLEASRKEMSIPETKNPERHQAQDSQDELVPQESTNWIHETYTSSERPPSGCSESTFAKPKKASRARPAERAHVPPSGTDAWKTVGSSNVSRPGSAHSQVSLPSTISESGKQQAETESEVEIDNTTNEIMPSPSAETSPVPVHPAENSADLESREPVEAYLDPDRPAVYQNPCCHDRRECAGKKYIDLCEQLRELKEDVEYLCRAWLQACRAASISSSATARFQSLVADSEIDTDTRVAMREELAGNELLRRISGLRQDTGTLQTGRDCEDHVLTRYRGVLAVDRGTPDADTSSHHDSLDWRDLHQQERRHLEALDLQHDSLRAAAVHTHRTQLQRRPLDHLATLPTLQHRRRSTHHAITSNGPAPPSPPLPPPTTDPQHPHPTHALLLHTTRLERANAALTTTLSRLRTTTSREIRVLILTTRAAQNEARSLRTARLAQYRRDAEGVLAPRESVGELRERRRREGEWEDWVEGVKEKVRRVRMEGLGGVDKGGEGGRWVEMWGGVKGLEGLEVEEREVLGRL
ncbi:hypothetical protein C7974DRAFT_417354 [Boeremia exigua]|uniref:uncharacterized protein n=1 Tax=Boeremia exigua TaxID=749465 RepID=UPI001E8E87BD|nr:uncharacterized protein C7974DRAFT_417354 [Boeremia exigua]KAH6615164.1 hypothetical protein C7974DRAFT_417354 [Boeremia exigua]